MQSGKDRLRSGEGVAAWDHRNALRQLRDGAGTFGRLQVGKFLRLGVAGQLDPPCRSEDSDGDVGRGAAFTPMAAQVGDIEEAPVLLDRPFGAALDPRSDEFEDYAAECFPEAPGASANGAGAIASPDCRPLCPSTKFIASMMAAIEAASLSMSSSS